MFKNIVSQLSLSPSAASQLTFYARRLGKERITRTFSAIAAVLLVGLQIATIAAPATPVNAASNNDIIFGGITSKNDLLNRFDGDPRLRQLFSAFGIGRSDLQQTVSASMNSRDHSLKSLGRIQHLSSDTPINVGGTTYWLRGLYTWDTGSNVQNGSNYRVLQGTRAADGGFFAVMMDCGNIVVKTLPPKPTPPPPPKPTPPPTPAPTPVPKKPTLACTYLLGSVNSGETPVKVDFTGVGTASGQTLTDYIFDFGDTKTATQSSGKVTHTYATPGKYVAQLQVKGSLGTVTAKTPPCSFTITVEAPPAAFNKHKSALNLTQNIDATTKPANAGDQIRYTLTTKNVGGSIANYVVVEHVEDILEYADITDSAGAQLTNGVMTWNAAEIKPGVTLTKTFVATIRNPIVATPVGVSDKNSFDLKLDNVYGNAVQISLQPPLPKQVEAAATSLPATGAGTSTLIVLLVSVFSLFFYFRNRQLLAEVKLLRNDYQGGVQ